VSSDKRASSDNRAGVSSDKCASSDNRAGLSSDKRAGVSSDKRAGLSSGDGDTNGKFGILNTNCWHTIGIYAIVSVEIN